MFQSPPKGATIPYRPKPVNGPVILANGQAFTIQGNYAVPAQEVSAEYKLQLIFYLTIPFFILLFNLISTNNLTYCISLARRKYLNRGENRDDFSWDSI